MVAFTSPNRVRAARLAKDLTLNELGRRLGVNPQTLWKLEMTGKGRRHYRVDLEALAAALDTTVEALFPEAAA